MTWKDALWCCVDVETTGLDHTKDKIIEIGWVRYQKGAALRSHSHLIDPGIPIPEAATKVNGITDEMVAGCQKLEIDQDVTDELLEAVSGAEVVIAYNWPFDDGFLNAALGHDWREATSGQLIVDPLVVVRLDSVGRYWKGKGRHKLGAVAERYGITAEGDTHRAAADCELTCRVLHKLLEHLPDDADECSRLLGNSRRKQDDNHRKWRRRQGSA